MPYGLRRAFLVLGVLGIGCGGGGSSNDSAGSTTGEPPPVPCDDATPCPNGEACVVGFCYGGDLPTLEITSPQEEQLVAWSNDGDTTDVVVTITGTGLTLVEAGMDPDTKRGQGQIAILVDGVDAAIIDTGDLAMGVEATVPVPTDAGGHAIRAEVRLSDGQPYATEGSYAHRFFWFDDGRPRVGFKAPFPNEVFPSKLVEVEVIVATINFQLVPATLDPEPGDVGHAHLLLNKSFPDCALDPVCLVDYIMVIAPQNGVHQSTEAPVLVPKTTATSTDLTAHLVQSNHDPYCGEGPDTCPAVWTSVTILREDEAAADTGGSDTTGAGSTTSTTGETADCGGFIASESGG